MIILKECIKLLPKNILKLKLDISNNYIGKYTENMEYLVDCIKLLPYNLQKLSLNLAQSGLG